MPAASRRAAVAAAIGVVTAVLPAQPATATGIGAAAVEGRLFLSYYPCPQPPVPASSCNGTLDMRTTAGADANGGAVTDITASFSVVSTCTLDVDTYTRLEGTVTVWHGATADPAGPFYGTLVGGGTTLVVEGAVNGVLAVTDNHLPLNCHAPTPVGSRVAGALVLTGATAGR
jgi:hypothetical protein